MDTVRRTRAYKRQIAEGRVAVPLTDASGTSPRRGGEAGGLLTNRRGGTTLQRTSPSGVPVVKEPSSEILCKRLVMVGVGVGASVVLLYLLLRSSVVDLRGIAEL